jgi:hypothetical protein
LVAKLLLIYFVLLSKQLMRGRLVVDENVLKDHFLRQQRGGNIAGFRVARMERGYGIRGIFKSFAIYAVPLFKQGAKVVGKRALQAATEVGQDVIQGKNARESFKSRGKQARSDIAENAARKVMIGKGRKKGIKRAAAAKTPIRGPTKKQKTSLDNFRPKWHGSSC